ncbi:MAG: nicotinamide riboside transporter PnuC [Bacteroidales bacterium]|nr:nicotinamide riboside transporter PnuC [Bacteroidales bacterium]MDZ4059203.1 nicotinamide riboside transporter PnuC [Bacteroidales bacterium]
MVEIFSTDNIIFSIGGQGVSLVEILSVASGLTCVYLATKAKVANFWMGYLYNILLFILFYQKGLYSSMLVQPISFIINFYGHYRWTHPGAGEENSKKQLKVTLMSNPKRVYFVLQTLIISLVWGFALMNIDDLFPSLFSEPQRPMLDAFVTVVILTAQYLSAQKKLECWAAWLTVNITNITLYILAGMAFLPMVSAAYLVLAFFGFTMWRKAWKENN